MKSPPRPVLRAIAHGAGAILLIAAVGAGWSAWQGTHDSFAALAMVGSVGALAWLGASLTVPSQPRAANDNDPVSHSRFDWRPIDDIEAA